MKIYLAGASKEITRAERWVKNLTDAGITVVSTWVDVIRGVGDSNPADATREQYQAWVKKDLEEVASCDALWLLLPVGGVVTIGAYVELGYAHALGKVIVASGEHKPIFTPALAGFHSHYDQEVFSWLKHYADRFKQFPHYATNAAT